ncbi:ABC transporter substrate-binding protein [Azospirillum thermophilum]|uniref:ABC transporter substrate-binding protein n=1 Tax=Azospirillum thermophilum TaxID=2202148 RepID=A0A2S2CKD4_9PROT|nr:ABC transporter substrate-binding protein [Azospirillum thermophilum]AWK84975.1 ABC transporter substrate-binding protein [Azospirillum thermophilum]
MTVRRGLRSAMLAAAMTLAALPAAAATKISFYYPVAVGGPITKLIDDYVAGFEKENPDVKVEPVYSGSYQDTITKVLTAMKGGDAPQVAVILSTDMYTLIDEDAIVPFEEMAKSADDKAFLAAFYPAFMENSRTGGKTWGIPFQRSTIVMYWNKEAFKEAGLDPEKPPQSWDEMARMAARLTKRDANGNVTQWGVQIPSSGFPYWLFQALTTENDVRLMNEAGTETYFDKPQVVEALQYWVDLAAKQKVHPPGIVEWGTTPKDFFERKVAMMWTTTGNLTNVRKNAPFPFGVAMLPEKARRGSPTGGGNFYVFKSAKPEQRDAAFRFVKWMTTPERAARWGIDTGYVAVRPDAWETPAMKAYVADFPAAAVARDQLPHATAELSTHDNQRVTKALNDGLQAALTGAKPPRQAMEDAQKEADRILKAYR